LEFVSWGWRIPFLLSIVLLGIGWFVRARLLETPLFEEIKRRREIAKNPFLEMILKNPKSFLIAVGLKISEVSWVYILTIFVVVYATSKFDLQRQLLLNAIFIAALVEVITIPLFGWLSDMTGRRIFYFVGTVFTVCFAFPLFWLLHTKDPQTIVLTVVAALSLGHGTMFGLQSTYFPELFGRCTLHRYFLWLPGRSGTWWGIVAHYRDGIGRVYGQHSGRIRNADRSGCCHLHCSISC
jgi:MFS transporter, MHS family, shikimate and dehydroshikimate transport protein